MTSDLAPFDVSWSLRWISDGVVRITSILGANINVTRLYTSFARFGNSIKVSVDDTPFGEESDSAMKHRDSYATGIRVNLVPTLYVGVTYGKRYEGDSVTTSLETGIRL